MPALIVANCANCTGTTRLPSFRIEYFHLEPLGHFLLALCKFVQWYFFLTDPNGVKNYLLASSLIFQFYLSKFRGFFLIADFTSWNSCLSCTNCPFLISQEYNDIRRFIAVVPSISHHAKRDGSVKMFITATMR